MFAPLTWGLVALSLAAAVYAVVLAARNKRIDWTVLGVLGVVEVGLIAQLVVGIVQLARGEDPAQGTTIFVAYLLGAFACVPAAGFLSLGERTRWGSVTVAASGVVLAVLEVRLYDIWGG